MWFYKLNFQTQLVLTSNQGIIHQLQSLEEIQVLNQRGRALQAHRGQEKHHFKNDVSKWTNQETKRGYGQTGSKADLPAVSSIFDLC